MERLAERPRSSGDLSARIAKATAARAEEEERREREARPARELASSILSAIVDAVDNPAASRESSARPGVEFPSRRASAPAALSDAAKEGDAPDDGVAAHLLGIWEPGAEAAEEEAGNDTVATDAEHSYLGLWEPTGASNEDKPAAEGVPSGLSGLWTPAAGVADSTESVSAESGLEGRAAVAGPPTRGAAISEEVRKTWASASDPVEDLGECVGLRTPASDGAPPTDGFDDGETSDEGTES